MAHGEPKVTAAESSMPPLVHRLIIAFAVAVTAGHSAAVGQFLDEPAAAAGPTLGEPRIQRFRVGIAVTAEGGGVRGLYATMPVPADWPEQKVRVVSEELSPGVRNLRYRMLAAGVKQAVVEIPDIAAGETMKAVVTFEIERAAIQAPADTSRLKIPEKPDRSLRTFLGPGPYIESRHAKIVKLAKEAAGDLEGWARVESIYDAVREKVEYREGTLKGAARALADGHGDCEELTCLFIACCRSQGIPARTVWVEGHCYPEFHLVDAAGNGWWFPCQAAGTRAFGSMPDCLPILQKGDAFRDPDRPAETIRYVSEFVRGTSTGDGQPRVQFIREGA